jgi:hypothetical protein
MLLRRKNPEADPKERSVGYGGRPDRDGRVTWMLVSWMKMLILICWRV